MKRLTLTFGFVVLAAVLAACSSAAAAPESTGQPSAGSGGTGTGDAVTIVAKDIAFKNPDVTVKAGAPVQIILDNQDGAPHNIAISDANGQGVFKGDIVSNTKVTYNVPALAAGTYSFICEVHPSMKGTITAK